MKIALLFFCLLQQVVSVNPKYPGIDLHPKPSSSRKAAIDRFHAEIGASNEYFDKCQEMQRGLVNYLRKPNTDSLDVQELKYKPVAKMCDVAMAHGKYSGSLAAIDKKWMSAKETDALEDILSRMSDVVKSEEYISQLLFPKHN